MTSLLGCFAAKSKSPEKHEACGDEEGEEGKKKEAIVNIITRRDVCGTLQPALCQPPMTLEMISRKIGNNQFKEVV